MWPSSARAPGRCPWRRMPSRWAPTPFTREDRRSCCLESWADDGAEWNHLRRWPTTTGRAPPTRSDPRNSSYRRTARTGEPSAARAEDVPPSIHCHIFNLNGHNQDDLQFLTTIDKQLSYREPLVTT